MIPSVDGINPDKENILKNEKSQSVPAESSFASKLSSLLLKKKGTKTENIKTTDTSFLKELNKLNLSAADFNPAELIGKAELKKPYEELYQVISRIREQLMGGIKNSILNLEKAIRDENLKMTPDLQEKFTFAIASIKNDFTLGFGIDFDAYQPVDINYNEDLFRTLFASKDMLPDPFIKKIDFFIS